MRLRSTPSSSHHPRNNPLHTDILIWAFCLESSTKVRLELGRTKRRSEESQNEVPTMMVEVVGVDWLAVIMRISHVSSGTDRCKGILCRRTCAL
ncbi:hypothetical protein PGT21_026259 [Puccinia graminis f. sp. tritici]|uniref:Uncharacterized protein n=1 Tax=Puccinia graminis f. sp. tritici TaxID=56615 RepID=A0A5B0MUR5_PUCGR|nr:hypothetical protein PGT21_026259 [Puccinia graminis f. sp. tritici]